MIFKNLDGEKIKEKIRVSLGVITIIGTVGLVPCGMLIGYRNNNFRRVINEDGSYELEGFISYENLINYRVVGIKTITDENKIYIAKKDLSNDYRDIYTGKKIVDSYIQLSGVVIPIVSSEDISEFLIAYDMIKEKYSEDDIEYLLNRISADYQNNKILKLLKTKDE